MPLPGPCLARQVLGSPEWACARELVGKNGTEFALPNGGRNKREASDSPRNAASLLPHHEARRAQESTETFLKGKLLPVIQEEGGNE